MPEIHSGDKHILVVNGESIPYGLARIHAIGRNLIEINATSPTGVREIENAYSTNNSGKSMGSIEQNLAKRPQCSGVRI